MIKIIFSPLRSSCTRRAVEQLQHLSMFDIRDRLIYNGNRSPYATLVRHYDDSKLKMNLNICYLSDDPAELVPLMTNAKNVVEKELGGDEKEYIVSVSAKWFTGKDWKTVVHQEDFIK